MPPAILLCRPVTWNLADPLEAEMSLQFPTYSGSVRSNCNACTREILVGPRQQQVLPNADLVLCYRCGIELMVDTGLTKDDIHNLGNPEGRLP